VPIDLFAADDEARMCVSTYWRNRGAMTKRDIRQGSSWRAETTPRAKWAERPDTLTPAQFAFCLAYIANGFNATAAYRAAYPKVGAATAATNG